MSDRVCLLASEVRREAEITSAAVIKGDSKNPGLDLPNQEKNHYWTFIDGN